jgi:glycosyltransferase involved in cell wall biosynthesis
LNSESQINDIGHPKLSIVIPLYNESESIGELHRQIIHVSDGLNLPYEIIYVDDCSRDGSFKILRELYESDTDRIKVIQFRRNFGKSEALSAGFSVARGDMIVTMDADLQDDPAEIPNLISKLNEGYDLVSGWKKKRKDPISKTIPSWFWNRFIRLMTRIKIHDMNCGLKIYHRDVIKAIQVYGELHRYIPVLAQWEGFIVSEIPVNHRPRKFGKSKYGPSRFFKGVFDLMTVLFLSHFNKRPLHWFGILGSLTFLGGAGITIYLLVLRILKISYLSNRPLFFIGVLLLIMGIQFISIGLLGEMITRTQASNHRFSIRQTLGI